MTEIQIPAIDEDDDFIKCYQSNFVEGGDISMHPPPHVSVNEVSREMINFVYFSLQIEKKIILITIHVVNFSIKISFVQELILNKLFVRLHQNVIMIFYTRIRNYCCRIAQYSSMLQKQTTTLTTLGLLYQSMLETTTGRIFNMEIILILLLPIL